MNFTDLIKRACGLQGIEIESYSFSDQTMQINFEIRQSRDSAKCFCCRGALGRVHEWIEREIKGPPIGAYKSLFRFYQLRAFCSKCETNRVAEVRWIHPSFSNYSCCFAEVAGRLMEETTCEAVGRILDANSSTLWSLDQYRMRLMLKQYQIPKEANLSQLSADEVHFRTTKNENREDLWDKRWEIKYITNLVCYKEGKVLWNSPGRDSDSLHNCLDFLSRGQKNQIKYFSLDVHEPFISAVEDKVPNATIVVDRFHLAKRLNEVFDLVRKSEFKKAKELKDEFGTSVLSPHRRFILVTREKDLSTKELKALERLRQINLPINNAMLLVEQFHQALDSERPQQFRKSLATWYNLVRQAKLSPFKKFARSIKRHRSKIEAYIVSRLTSAVSEGLNNKIKTLKRVGYGYTNQQAFRRKILQRCGYLNSNYINTNDYFFEVKTPL